MIFERSILSDAALTMRKQWELVLILMFLLPVIQDFFSFYVQSNFSGAATHVVWNILLYNCLHYVLNGYDHKALLQRKDRKLVRFLMINFALEIIVLGLFIAVCLAGMFDIIIQLGKTSVFGISLIVVCFLCCALLVYAVLGTWLPARVHGKKSGIGFAFGRARGQAGYIALRLVILLVPHLMLLGGFFIAYGFFLPQASLDIIDKGFGFHPDALLFNAIFLGLITFGYVIFSVVLARAYVREELKPAEGEMPLAIPYLS